MYFVWRRGKDVYIYDVEGFTGTRQEKIGGVNCGLCGRRK